MTIGGSHARASVHRGHTAACGYLFAAPRWHNDLMGTRGFVGFVIDNTEKIFISHGDSYPSEVGSAVLSWLTGSRNALLNRAPGGVPDKVRALRLLDDEAERDPADIEWIRGLLRESPEWADSAGFIDDVSEEELLEFVTYDLDTLLEAGITGDGSEFPTDSLFCEWGYLIDLDAATFEVYRGFQRAPHDAGRFAHRPPAREHYYPVALVASWPLANLPDRAQFLATLDRN